MSNCKLYLITPPIFDIDTFEPKLKTALDAGPIAALQIRLKGVTRDTIMRATDRIRPIVHSRNIALIMNDFADIALETGCDGVHIGRDTNTVRTRSKIGSLRLGVSCYDSQDIAVQAAKDGADYIAFGAFFASSSKETDIRATPDLLTWWSSMAKLPVVAIGGITPANCSPLVKAGANFLAVINAIWKHPEGPAMGVKSMLAAMKCFQ